MDEVLCGKRITLRSYGPQTRPEGNAGGKQPRRFTFGDLDLEWSSEDVRIWIAVGSVRQVFFTRATGHVRVSDDPHQILVERPGYDLMGLACQLELSAIIPPLSPWQGVRRALPGSTLRISAGDARISEEVAALQPLEGRIDGPCDDPTERVAQILETVVHEGFADRPCAVLFSGGVDSSLLAALAHRDGRSPLLVHSTRGANDRETLHAQKVAQELGLEMIEHRYDPDESIASLQRMFRSFAPINDFSLLANWGVAERAIAEVGEGGVIFDGTGADGLFGAFASWDRKRWAYRVPRSARMLLGRAYERLRMWEHPSKLEDRLRMVRRTTRWSFPAVGWTVHALGGIAYCGPEGFRIKAAEHLDSWLERAGARLTPSVRPILLAVPRLASSYCQKPVTPIETGGGHVRFPFMTETVVRTALFEAMTWDPEYRERKGVLKRLLARYIPDELVYRRGAGFTVPPIAAFAQPGFLDALDEVIEDQSGPFAELIDRQEIRRMRDLLASRKRMGWYAYGFVWGLVFAHHWVVGLEEGWT